MQLSTDPLMIVKMGKQSRADAVALWDWSVRAPAWWDFILE
jgi:hypothetical protein